MSRTVQLLLSARWLVFGGFISYRRSYLLHENMPRFRNGKAWRCDAKPPFLAVSHPPRTGPHLLGLADVRKIWAPGCIRAAIEAHEVAAGHRGAHAAVGLGVLDADRGGLGNGSGSGPLGTSSGRRQAADDRIRPTAATRSVRVCNREGTMSSGGSSPDDSMCLRGPLMSAPSSELILVIDDDEAVRKTSVVLLSARGLTAVAASSVGEGLRLFAERRPAAVLLDLKLPDGTGIDVLRELQRQAPGTPVVVISGHGSVAEAVEAMKVGATDFLEKPVSRDRLFRSWTASCTRPFPAGRRDLEGVADGSRYGMVGRSEAMRRIYQLVEMAAPRAAAS